MIRGGREMENHFECLWDLFRSIPSLEHPENSVLDEYYWLNKEDPNYSLCRATVDRGKDAHTDGKFTLSDKAALEIMKLFLTRDEDLYDRTITDVFTEEFFRSNFWLYWRTMFAFETWHSALEMKLYLQRFIHHIGGLPDFSALKFTQYNQYESLILPMVHYLKEHNVQFQYDTQVTNVIFDIAPGRKLAKQLVWVREGREEVRELTEDDLVFVTNGSCTENSSLGSNDRAPEFLTEPVGGLLAAVAEHRCPGPGLRPPGQVLHQAGPYQLGVGHRHHPGRQDPAPIWKRYASGTPSPGRWSPVVSSR